MVLIIERVQLPIPSGGLTIQLEGSDPAPVKVQVRLDTWWHGLRIVAR